MSGLLCHSKNLAGKRKGKGGGGGKEGEEGKKKLVDWSMKEHDLSWKSI